MSIYARLGLPSPPRRIAPPSCRSTYSCWSPRSPPEPRLRGYYQSGRLLVAVLAGAALMVAHWDRPALAPGTWPVLAAGAGLAGWVLARAAAGGSVDAGLPVALTLACLAAGMLVVQHADAAQRELCAASAVGVGVLVAATGWLDVAWHREPLALVADRRLWRATSTLTYANAAAALIAVLCVLAIALLAAQPSSPVRAGAVYLLLVGLGATLSRGGVIALLVGLVVLATLAGVRATAKLIAAPALGAAVAVASLAPSFPIAAGPHPVLAVGGLVAGLLIALGVPRLPDRIRPAALLAGFAAALIAIGLLAAGRDLGGTTSCTSSRRHLRQDRSHPDGSPSRPSSSSPPTTASSRWRSRSACPSTTCKPGRSTTTSAARSKHT